MSTTRRWTAIGSRQKWWKSYRVEWQHAIANRQIAESEYNAVLNQQWAVGQQVEAQQTELDRANLAVDYLRESGVDPLLETAVSQAEANLAATVLTRPVRWRGARRVCHRW